MSPKELEQFNLEYQTTASNSYIVLKANSEEVKLKNYQLDMIKQNRIEDLLPMECQRVDEKLQLYYRVTSRIPLKKLLEKKEFERSEFINVICRILDCIIKSSAYLLNESNFILDSDYIYVDAASLNVYMMYLPVELNEDITEKIKCFLKKLITEEVNFSKNKEDNYIQRILDFMKKDNFSIYEFGIFIKKLESISNTSAMPCVYSTAAHENSKNNNKGKSSVGESNSGIKKEPEIPKTKGKTKRTESENAKDTEEKAKQGILEKMTGFEAGYPKSSYIIAGTVNLVIIFLIIFMLVRGSFRGPDSGANILGLFIITGGAEYFVFTKLFTRDKIIPVASTQIKDKIPKSCQDLKKEKPKELKYRENMEYIPVREEAASVQSSIVDQTVILVRPDNEEAYLEDIRGDYSERIRIVGDSFIIGRIHEQVDCVINNPAVGKIHAEIIKENGKYYIKDLNSRNGTFVNDERINSNINKPINSFDKITLANSEFVFMYPNKNIK